MKEYVITHKSKAAFDNHLSKINARGGRYEIQGNTIRYWFEEGGKASVSGGENWPAEFRSELIKHANAEIESLGITEDVKIKLSDKPNRLAGSVALSEKPKKITSVTIYSNAPKNKIKELISHELVHVEQINNGRLFLENGNVIYNGETVMSIKEYKKQFGGKWNKEKLQNYEKLPWEKPAYEREKTV